MHKWTLIDTHPNLHLTRTRSPHPSLAPLLIAPPTDHAPFNSSWASSRPPKTLTKCVSCAKLSRRSWEEPSTSCILGGGGRVVGGVVVDMVIGAREGGRHCVGIIAWGRNGGTRKSEMSYTSGYYSRVEHLWNHVLGNVHSAGHVRLILHLAFLLCFTCRFI